MSSVKKIVLVTAEHHPYHKLWVKLAERISKELNVPLEVKKEDYVYVNEYGDKDEFGMAWLPQILAELNDGTVRVLLSQLPLNQALQPDEEKALEIMKSKALGSQ
ncbi:MAG: hypothetical protein JHC12_00775 [Thermogladius sp.]|jgi:hypothetical protein|nr:hypothetical protein [Thermogladius sp.]